MGLGDTDLNVDADGGGCKAVETAAVACSICLEAVSDNGDRSWAKLQCGHQFHLDCIGSAFNIKGAMQCPNCRKIEKGQWRYANGNLPLPEFNLDDWPHEEDLYDLGYSEMSFGVHWCPFGGLTRLPSSFDEGEFPSSTYHDLAGHHAFFAEHTPVSSTTHPCPYIGYFGPHPSSTTSSTSVSDGSNYSNHWTGQSVPSDVPNSYVFPSMDVHYHSWDHSSPFTPSNQIGGADQPLITPMTQRTARNSYDIPGTGMHPFILGHSSASRAPSSATSTVLAPHPVTVARARDRQSLQAYFQQSTSNPSARQSVISTRRRSSSRRGVAQTAPIASSFDHSGSVYYFPSTSRRNFHEVENPHPDVFHGWDREHQPLFPSSMVDRESIWGRFHQPGGASESGVRSSIFRQGQGNGSERMPSQNQNRS